jgi:hypothetical protein
MDDRAAARRAPAHRDGPAGLGHGSRAESRDPERVAPGLLSLAIEDASRAGLPAIAALQRTVGNQAVAEVIQRQRAGGASQLPAPTNDQIVAELGPALGGPFASYSAFAASMRTGSFLGHTIDRGVRPEFLVKLSRAEGTIETEYTMSGRRRPQDEGITNIGGFRNSAGFHGWGIAIDIDVARNPYVMHEEGDEQIDVQTGPVYHRIAQFILNRPIGDQQSIVPRLLRPGQPLSAGGPTGRRGRAGEYYDRLLLESDAMKRYFELMNDQTKLAAFLATEWPTIHPNEPAPTAAAVTRQMWQDFATLGGAIPRGGPAGVTGFTRPAAVEGGDRPFNPTSAGQQDPGQGFLTIPREVVLGLSQELSRWGAIDFPGGRSGDVQHFDDGAGDLGQAITSAKAAATRRIRERAAAQQPTPAVQPDRGGQRVQAGQPGAALQRWIEPSEGGTGGVYRGSGSASSQPQKPAKLTQAQRLSGPHWKAIADQRWGGATPDINELESGFAGDLQRFLDMLTANGISYEFTSGLRPPERAYLFHWCVKIWKGDVLPKDVPAMAGVDIIWDHGNDADSIEAAKQLARKFKLVGVAALHSNHSAGTAMDMVFDFTGNPKNEITYALDGKAVTRKIKVDDEALKGQDNTGRVISGIAKRELTKAGADFGVKRAVDNDIVHWSRTGR